MSMEKIFQMNIKLVVLKSGEDLIADVKEIRGTGGKDVIGYWFSDPLILKIFSEDEPQVLSEETGEETESGTTKKFGSKLSVTFYPWVPLSADREIPCSADWVVTIVNPQENLVKLYEERVNGRPEDDQDSSVIDESVDNLTD